METVFFCAFCLQSNRDKGPDRGSLQRTITWRPTSAKAVIPPGESALHFKELLEEPVFFSLLAI